MIRSAVAFLSVVGVLLAAGVAIGAPNAAPTTEPIAPTASTIPTRDFVRRDEFSRPVLSPDGQHVVLNRRVPIDGKDVTVMVVHHLPDMKLESTVRLPVFEMPLTYRWLTNSRLAVATGIEQGSIDKPYATGEVMAVDIDGAHQEYLYGYKPGMRRRNVVKGDEGFASIAGVPAGRNGHVYLTEHPWGVRDNHTLLYDVDSVGAARRLVTEIDQRQFRFVLDAEGNPKFASGDGADAFLSVYRFDTAKQQWVALAGDDKANLYPVAMAADGLSFHAYYSERGGPRMLIRQSTVDGTRSVEAKDDKGSIDLVQWSAMPYAPVVVATNLDTPTVRYLDDTLLEAKLHQLLSAQFPGDYLRFMNFSDDGQKLLFSVASDRNPGDYYLFDRKTSKAELLFSAASWLDPERMAHQRPVHFNASDGLELHGYLTMPAVQGDAKPPLILLPHGGPHEVADEWFFDTDVQFLASRGYAVLQVNYRGSGGRGVAFEAAGYRRWGTRIQDDLIDGVRWVIGQGAVDGDRVCVAGGSFGAYSAMMAVSRAPDLFKCAVGYAGLYDLPLIYSADQTRRDKRIESYFTRVIGRDTAELQSQSPTHVADRITVPVLLVHGGDDKRCEPAQAYAMREALTKAGHPPEWMFVDGEGHGFYAEKNRQAYYERLEAFLAKNLAKNLAKSAAH